MATGNNIRDMRKLVDNRPVARIVRDSGGYFVQLFGSTPVVLESIMFDANVNLLTEKIEEFYVSPYFLTLSTYSKYR